MPKKFALAPTAGRHPDKFPQGYMFELNGEEFADLRSKISTAKLVKTRFAPKAFAEKDFT